MSKVTLEKIGPENLSACGIGCLINAKNQGYQAKVEWLQKRFAEGLRFLLFRDEEGKPLAFLEYVPGEYAWRPVEAKGWLFVHCLWVYPRGQKVGGLGSRLLQACLQEARQAGAHAYLLKQIGSKGLVDRIKEMVRTHAPRLRADGR